MSERKEWRELWRIGVPSIVRVFLWRLARNSIPTGVVHHNKNMAPHGGCSLCGQPDSWQHSLIDCNVARCVCSLEKVEIAELVSNAGGEDMRGWVAELLQHLKQEEMIRVVVRLWAIWYVRRKAIYGDQFQSPLSTHCFVERFAAELELIKPESKKKQTMSPSPQ